MFRAFAKAHKLATEAHARIAARVAQEPALQQGRGLFMAKKESGGSLYIYEGIGASFWGGGITAKDVADKLNELKGAKTLDIYINSEGGDVFEGKAIYNSLRRFDGQKTVHIDGIAASAASFIAMAADPGSLVIAENATVMIHEAWGMAMGNAGDMRALADVLDSENKAIAGIYASRTGQPVGDFWARAAGMDATGLMAAETWMDAAQAVSLKLADRIEKNNAPADDGQRAAASNPAFVLAKQTQERIASSRRAAEVLAREQSLLNDRRRASPQREAQRPAARTP